jgi:hypothetical protein
VPIEAFLAGELGKAGSLGDVAVIAVDDLELEVEPAQADEAEYVVEAHSGAAGFPAGDRWLSGVCESCKFSLGEPGASPGLSDQMTTVRTHY